jgi:hypothetical protein
LAAEYDFRGFIAAIASIDCSQNDAITGKRLNDSGNIVYGEKLAGGVALCSSLSGSSITSLNFSGCQLNSESLTLLTEAISSMAAVDTVILKYNMITGSNFVFEGDALVWKYDVDLSGLMALCEALPGLKTPISLDLSSCGLSVKGVNEIAKAVSAGAAITKVDLRNNHMDKKALAVLREAAPAGCAILADAARSR